MSRAVFIVVAEARPASGPRLECRKVARASAIWDGGAGPFGFVNGRFTSDRRVIDRFCTARRGSDEAASRCETWS